MLPWLALAAALIAGQPSAAHAEVPAMKQALIVMRVLAYDRALDDRASRSVRIAVVHGSSSDSLSCASRMREAFDRMAGRVTVDGKPIEVDTVSASSVTGDLFSRRQISVAYICRGSGSVLPQLIRASQSARVLTFSDQLDYVQRGLSVALTHDRSRVRLAINLESARAEGARLDSQLLRISKVVKR